MKQVDPGVYLITGFGESGNGATSYHRFLDGTMLKISYIKKSSQYFIEDMWYFEDPMHFIDVLLPQDLAVIS